MTTPLICGSIIRDKTIEGNCHGLPKISNLTFDRKLRMIRADIFALFSCTMNGHFIKRASVAQLIKKTLNKFLESE